MGNTQMWQRFIPDVRVFWKPPFQYALLVTSTFAPKLLHLWSHVYSLPVVLYVLYMPTFLALDVVNALLFWVLVHAGQGRARTKWTALIGGLRVIVCLVVLCASAMTMAFFVETGGEIKWGTAKSFANEAGGIKVLLSGSVPACLASAVIVIAARILSQPLYNGSEKVINTLVKTFTGRQLKSWSASKEEVDSESDVERGLYSSLMSPDEDDSDSSSSTGSPNLGALEAKSLPAEEPAAKWYTPWILRAAFLTPFVTTVILLWVRPTTFPYAHMSGSIPFTLAEIWNPPPDICIASYSQAVNPFPLTDLIREDRWEQPNGKFIGWMPNSTVSSITAGNPPSWLPKEKLHGFERWYNESTPYANGKQEHGKHHRMKNIFRYDPLQDPAKISNLDQKVLDPISEALKSRKISIKHVILMSLESTRTDVFPLKKGSHMYDNIMKTNSGERAKQVEEELSQLTLNAELLTGESGGFAQERNTTSVIPGSWRDLKHRGGINVHGALTGSTTSFKSFLGSHCGVSPLPVDFTVETFRKIYQPCIPQVLSLLNHNKPSTEPKPDDITSMPWRSVFAQSITDQYDHQDELNRHIGFLPSNMIVKEMLLAPGAKYPPTEKESNYFGFPESQIKPYLRDLFTDAEKNNERLFLSHFTSSTHHPWNTPEAAGPTFDFLNKGKFGSEHQLNRYLNTIRYGDRWIGEVMDMLQELGVAEETLVVMVGDHGMAFEEDSRQYSTFENGHISNLRVPLNFHHPSLPRIQLQLNATSTSILPTILDLLATTSSLNKQDTDVAENLIQQYEGQSLVRAWKPEHNGRQQWDITVLNAGGAVLSVGSAAVPYRLVLPVCKAGTYRFTDVSRDPAELAPIEEFSVKKLAKKIRKLNGDDKAAAWIADAEKVGKWWVLEQRRRWNYHGGASAKDADAGEFTGMGRIKKEHWWET